MADIFLSYKREDRDKVRPLVEALQAQSWSVWWDNRIGAGETWDQVIEAELRAAKCVLVVWSKRSIESDWVRAEAHDGRERKRLIPIIVEGVTPPSIFRMIQATDLSSWKGELDDPNFSHVCAGIARLLRLDEAPTEPPPVTSVQPVPAVAIPVTTESAAEKLLPAQAEVTKPVNPSMPTVEPAAAEPAKHEPVGSASALPLQTPAPAETAPAENVPTPVRAPERPPPDPRFAIAIAAAVALLVGVGSTYLLLSHRNAVMGATAQSSSGTNASAAEPLPTPSTTLSPQEAPRTASEKADPPPPELPKSVPDAAAVPSGLAAPKLSANDLAIETQTRIIDNDPRNVDAFLARGIAYVSKFEQDNAISDLTQAIEINPKSAAAFTYRGLAYRRKGDNKRALAEYARAITINANYADAYNNRGYLKNSEKDFDGARADFNKAISINGKYAEAYYGRAPATTDCSTTNPPSGITISRSKSTTRMPRTSTAGASPITTVRICGPKVQTTMPRPLLTIARQSTSIPTSPRPSRTGASRDA